MALGWQYGWHFGGDKKNTEVQVQGNKYMILNFSSRL